LWIEGTGKPQGCKLIRISAEIEGEILKSIQIRGDFFASPEESFERVEKALAGIHTGDLAAVFDRLVREAGIENFGISGAGLAAVVNEAWGKRDGAYDG
jgi:hypothetical protein